MLMMAWMVLMFVTVVLQNRWRKTGVLPYLFACYAAMYIGIGLMLLSLWHGDRFNHWFAVVGCIFLVVSVPWMMRGHRREVQKYGRTP